ncbi:hypothetical protein EST38_g9460 [Candolleomyces aberdarensis]|uniref:Uncharacterized protein n=1 Tax=Candolleomyces aberdarensis TaxID=2316362 RepID=A0A4Q2DC20_9AGAR|nr:hypothetical protein EST38_g9460 [Candolleomyces aberdarensis]
MPFPVFASINQAINFLTLPLSLVHSPVTIHALQTILRSTFYAALAASTGNKLVLTFTASSPPRPVFAACVAIGVQWAEWIEFFGQRDFDLIIDSHSVVARYHATNGLPSQTVTIWSEPIMTPSKRSLLARLSVPDVARVPIRKLGQQAAIGAKERTAPAAPLPRIILPSASLQPQPRTLAQQLIDSDDEDADELFAMISKTSIISPTPTRERFIIPSRSNFKTNPSFVAPMSPISSPEPSSPESSRPNSRTSHVSSCFSDEGSLSSASSVPTTVSYESAEESETTSPIYVDHSKKDKTKYLYQGGVSSTLTGGVMLGCPSGGKAKASPKPAPPTTSGQPKYRPPMARGKRVTGANAPSWRRSAVPVRQL